MDKEAFKVFFEFNIEYLVQLYLKDKGLMDTPYHREEFVRTVENLVLYDQPISISIK